MNPEHAIGGLHCFGAAAAVVKTAREINYKTAVFYIAIWQCYATS
jgi:hypothetical protein